MEKFVVTMGSLYVDRLKRTLDFAGALGAIIVTSPVLCLLSVILAIQNRGGIFFRQKRIGKGGETFNIIKFRSMNNRRASNGELLADHLRLTATGRWIRHFSLDELPQFINILKGDMSFVGPRPLLPEYMDLYSDRHKRRHEVMPGLTGWAQCHGRNNISWGEKFELDLWYVDNISFKTDCRVIATTIKTLFNKKNSESAVRDVVKFNGHN